MGTDLVKASEGRNTRTRGEYLKVTVRRLWGDIERRNIFAMQISIPANLVMAGWKISLLVITPSLFLLANAAFNVGCAAAKVLAVRCSRSRMLQISNIACGFVEEQKIRVDEMEWKTYWRLGMLITSLSLVYTLSCVPMFFDSGADEPYDEILAITIATVTFTEIGLNIRGMVVARNDKRVLLEGIKWLNLASALLLVVLTQTAIMSFSNKGDNLTTNALSGVVFGSLATGIGVYMLMRYRRAKAKSFDAVKKD
jgi:hypothetical protein